MRPILSMAWVRGYWYVHFTASISWPSGLTARKDEFEVKRLPLQGENTDTGVCESLCSTQTYIPKCNSNVDSNRRQPAVWCRGAEQIEDCP